MKMIQKCHKEDGSISLLNCGEIRKQFETIVKVRRSAVGKNIIEKFYYLF